MQAVVLTAGRGTRIRPLSDTVPKPMLPVADRPIVAHVASAAVRAGADELVFVVGYEAQAVRDYFGEAYGGIPVRYAVQEEQAGTADAVRAAADLLDGEFAVLNGDNLYEPADVAALFDAGPSVAAVHRDDPSSYGVLSTTMDGERVTDIEEKPENPTSTLVNAGAYVFPAKARNWLDVLPSERDEHEITDVLAKAIECADVTPVELDGWLDVGRPWELLSANEWKLAELDGRVDGDVSETAILGDDVVVEAGATIADGCIVEGPTLIRTGAEIGPHAYVRGATLIAQDATVGHGVEVANSVVMPNATLGHSATVFDSVVGPDAFIGACTAVENTRHDGEPVALTVKGRRVSTGRQNFGVVVGPDSSVSVDTTFDPGVTLQTGATTEPGERVSSDR